MYVCAIVTFTAQIQPDTNTDLCLIDAVHNIDNSKWSEMIIPSMIVNLLKIQIMAVFINTYRCYNSKGKSTSKIRTFSL